jgi:aryl-alcohol dehydrogenase-like predicted oxidoreductase
MAPFPHRVQLGRTGLSVGPLGVAGGYGVDARSLRSAFDRGVNYWYHGSFRRDAMAQAIREITAAGQRDQLVVLLQSYTRWPLFLERSFKAGLQQLGLDHADVLLLGWYNGKPWESVLERAVRLREQGLVRHLAISGHHRPAFVDFAADARYGILHLRYGPAHPGAERDVFPHLAPQGRPGVVAYTATSWGQLLNPRRMPPGEPTLRARDVYRFVLTNPDFQVCMTGPKDAAQMDEALATLDAGPLDAAEMERVRRIGAHVHG